MPKRDWLRGSVAASVHSRFFLALALCLLSWPLPDGSAGVSSSNQLAMPGTSSQPVIESTTTAERTDVGEVRRKIAAFATPDDTIPYDQQPRNWLAKRRDQILPQLIAGLDDPDVLVARGCLAVLYGVPLTPELTEALIAKAGQEKSPLRYGALVGLEKASADPRVAKLLDQASTDAADFPWLIVRAKWAFLAGQKDRAVEMIGPVLTKKDGSLGSAYDAIRLLAEIATPNSAKLLESVAANDDWSLAIQSHLALAKTDPQGHGLTKDQVTFLQGAGGLGKETTEQYRARMAKLALLNVKEVRPFVMQMLRDKKSRAIPGALLILAIWKDKDALPEIRTLLRGRRYVTKDAVAAYLTIDGSDPSRNEVLELLTESTMERIGGPAAMGNPASSPAPFVRRASTMPTTVGSIAASGPAGMRPPIDRFQAEWILGGIIAADIPVEGKVAMLRKAQAWLDSPYTIPYVLGYNREHLTDLLGPLMDAENDLLTLGFYCKLASGDEHKRFAPQVRHAMNVLIAQRPPSSSPAHANTRSDEAAEQIVAAVAAYDLKDLTPDVQKLMSSENAAVRLAAQVAGARLGIAGSPTELYEQLKSDDAAVRVRAAQSLMTIKPVDEVERAAREEACLACLGKPCEDYAMPVLVTCGGGKTAKALEPILDDVNPQRAVYAGWVMAQLPDESAARKGLRRVAIMAMFYHQMYQQGAGIDFPISAQLQFHQTTERLNPGLDGSVDAPVRIPPELLGPFALEGSEAEYAIRCYRFAQARGERVTSIPFLSVSPFPPARPSGQLDKSYVPLLEVIAKEDSRLKRVMVKGNGVAHFEYRQLAAQAIAAITGREATYVGLAGEALDSQAFSSAYGNQDMFLAKYMVDWIETHYPPVNPQTDLQRPEAAVCRWMALSIGHEFGASALVAIRKEAERRGVSLKGILSESDDKLVDTGQGAVR